MSDTRVTTDEDNTLANVTKALGAELWKHSVLVFTHADNLRSRAEYFEALRVRTELLRQALSRGGVALEIAGAVPSLAVTNTQNGPGLNPDGETWLGALYSATFCRVSDAGWVQYMIGISPERLETVAEPVSLSAREICSSRTYGSGRNAWSSGSDSSSYPNRRATTQITLTSAQREPMEARVEQAAKSDSVLQKIWTGARTVATVVSNCVSYVANTVAKPIATRTSFRAIQAACLAGVTIPGPQNRAVVSGSLTIVVEDKPTAPQ